MLCHVSRVDTMCHVSHVDTDNVWSTVSWSLCCDHRSVIILWQLGHITISTRHCRYINGPPIVSSLSLRLNIEGRIYLNLDRVETWKVYNKLSYRDFLEAVRRGESPQASAWWIHSFRSDHVPPGTTAIVWLLARALCTTLLNW